MSLAWRRSPLRTAVTERGLRNLVHRNVPGVYHPAEYGALISQDVV